MAHLIDWKELYARIIVYKIVEPPRSQAVAGDDTIAGTRFAAASHYAGPHQVHGAVSGGIPMEAEGPAIFYMTQRLSWDPGQPDLQGGAVVDDRGDIACHTFRDLPHLRMNILRDGRINPHQRIEPGDMNEALAVGARHRRIDLHDNRARNA